MATITPRGGRFLVRVRKQGFPTLAKTFQRRADAAAWGRRIEADMEAGRWAPPEEAKPTLAEAVDEYRRTVAVKLKGAKTYSYRYDQFQALGFAAKAVNEVTPSDIARWRDAEALSLKPGTVVRKLAMLSAIFTWAMKERGWVESNPVRMITWPRASDRRERVLSDEEHRYLMDAARTSKASWLAPALALLLNSAMRRGELFALRRRDIDIMARVAHLADTKNGGARDVPLCPRSLTAVRALIEAAGDDAGAPLLPVGQVGSVSTRFKVTVKRARTAYEADCAMQGRVADPSFLGNLRLHDLRHTAVTAWASTGELSLPQLLAVSGHKTPRMVMRYTHLSAAALANRLAAIQQGTVAGVAA